MKTKHYHGGNSGSIAGKRRARKPFISPCPPFCFSVSSAVVLLVNDCLDKPPVGLTIPEDAIHRAIGEHDIPFVAVPKQL